jgi:16S rRNA (guanine527-N7)-methyltransferase
MSVVPRETEPKFLTLLKLNGISPSVEQMTQLQRYQQLLIEWNKQINLVSRSTTEDVIYCTHFIHSLSPFFFCSVERELRVLDIGSGGGLPGIPIAILKPDLRMVLSDSIAKKAKAMESIVSELALSNVQVVNSRAEELFPKGYMKEKFDLVLARAVAPLPDLVGWSVPAVRRGAPGMEWKQSGRGTTIHLPALMAWKGGELTDELAAMERRTGHTGRVFPLVFPGSDQPGLEDKKLVMVELRPAGGGT